MIVGQDIAELFGYVADGFHDRVEALTWVDDDRVS